MSETLSAQETARLLGLERLPVEGTFYRQTYRSSEELPDGTPAGTAMIGMYSAEPPSFSCFHRLTRHELWHFYSGDPFELILLYPGGGHEAVVMGPDVAAGEKVQVDVPPDVWQAGRLVSGGRMAVYGCTLAPGFTPSCFEAAEREKLLSEYPDMAEIISELSPVKAENLPDDLDR